jgi:hypothetical protein
MMFDRLWFVLAVLIIKKQINLAIRPCEQLF